MIFYICLQFFSPAYRKDLPTYFLPKLMSFKKNNQLNPVSSGNMYIGVESKRRAQETGNILVDIPQAFGWRDMWVWGNQWVKGYEKNYHTTKLLKFDGIVKDTWIERR